MSTYRQLGNKSDRQELASLIAAQLLQAGLPAFKQDINQLLTYLHEAVERGSSRLLATHLTSSHHISYLTTSRHVFYARDPSLGRFFTILKNVLSDSLSPTEIIRSRDCLEAAVSACLEHINQPAGYVCRDARFVDIATGYLAALLSSNRDRAMSLIMSALEQKLVSIKELYLHVFQPVQYEVGRLWLLNKISVTEEHFCTAATQAIMSDLYPRIISSHRAGKTLVAACIGSELHEIGIRMVADFFEMEGWDTYYLGAGISNDVVISAAISRKADLVALSATMTYHVTHVQNLISAIRQATNGCTPQIMVGGMPFNSAPDLWRQVGADLWAVDAEQAVLTASG